MMAMVSIVIIMMRKTAIVVMVMAVMFMVMTRVMMTTGCLGSANNISEIRRRALMYITMMLRCEP